ncbi:RHS repeat-associated core domain-containing protein [Trabulsiella odontotermitis]|uniref:RHS repeat-associated core domain-containing protein n=1 Tax=Trabulsiella odontotermitis TaxID=379893 RepID=UPI003ABE6FCA
MADDFLAAKVGDQLEHKSIWADLVGGIVKGAIYAAIGVAAVAATAATGGAALAVGVAAGVAGGFVLGDAIDAVSDGIGELIGGTSMDGTIITGSPDVNTKSKPAARAAGSVPSERLYALIEYERQNPPKNKALAIAEGIAKKAFMLTPVGMLMSAGSLLLSKNSAAPAEPPPPLPENTEPKKSFLEGVWDGIVAPVAAPKDPYATPKDNDKIVCEKWHPFGGPLYLAEGSNKVQINSQPAARNGDRSTCEAVIKHSHATPRVRIGGGSVAVRDIRSGKNPIMDFAGQLVGSAGVGLLGAGVRTLVNGGLRNCLRAVGCTLAMETIGAALGSAVGGIIGEAVAAVTNPVNAATGAKVLYGEEDLDFVLQGQYPLYWQRIYNSRNASVSVLGRGWSLPFDVSVRLEPSVRFPGEDEVIYTDRSGRDLPLGIMAPGSSFYYVDEGFRMYRSLNNIFLLETPDGYYQLFEADPHRINHLRLAKSLDRHENSLTYRYNPEGKLTHIYDDVRGVSVQLRYHPRYSQRLYQVIQYSEAQNERLLVEYEYNAEGELTGVQNADGRQTRRFAYDPDHHLMTMHQFATGLQARYRWQWLSVPDELRSEGDPAEQGYVAEYWLMDGEQCLENSVLEYDLAQRTLRVDQSGIGVSIRHWDTRHQITEYTNVYGHQWVFEWNDKRQLCSVVDPQGRTYRYEYDDRGNLSADINPQNEKTFTEWDEDFALPLSRILPNGGAWYYQYGARGDLISLIDPAEQITRYDYDDLGNMIRYVDAKGNEYHYAWNLRGQLTRQTDCSGYLTQVKYDEWGQVARVTDAQGGMTLCQFSAAGLLEKYSLPDGRQSRYEYDAAGQLRSVEGPEGDVIRLEHNRRGFITQRTDARLQNIRFEYDSLGRLIRLLNEKGEAYRFGYDALHRLTTEYDLSGQCKEYQYNASGDLVLITHFPDTEATGLQYSPLITRFEHDAAGRVRAKITHDNRTEYEYGSKDITVTRFTHAEWQQALAEQRDPDALDSLEFTRDILGRITGEKNHGGQYQHHYDPLGNLLSTVLPDRRILSHLYYGSGYLQQTNLTANGKTRVLAEYERDRLHREVSRSQGELQLQTEYDVCGRVVASITRMNTRTRAFTPVIDKRYTYDARDNITERIVTYGFGDRPLHYGPRESEQYHYDPAGQILARVKGHDTVHYLYDAAANLLDRSVPVATQNRIMQFGEYAYQYDGFGRMSVRTHTRKRIRQFFEYNSEHRLTDVRFENHPEFSHAQYRYDALGRRTHKVLYRHEGKGVPAREPETITYFWNGMVLSGEVSSARPKNSALYTYRDFSYEPLARVDTCHYDDPDSGREYDSVEVFYYHNHVNGMPEELTDEEGEIRWRSHISLWGNTLREENVQYTVVPQNLRLQGQYLDRETGLHYNIFRYYDPVSGRFTQPDPIGLNGGINLYQYVPNPLSWIDPLGLANRPNNGKYNIFFEHSVDPSNRYSSDAVQFNRANTEFVNKMNTDPAFRRDMLGRYPQLSEWMKNGDMSRSPTGLTWHHHEDVNRLVLVDRLDHRLNHALYHPTGVGGRDIWGGGKPGRQGKLNGATGSKC